jgi:hypothetical protein
MRSPLVLVSLILAACAAGVDRGPDVAFLTAEQARAAIVDESVEPYFSLLQTQEMSCKTAAAIDGATLDAQRDSCRARYQSAVADFPPAEQAALQRVVAGVQPFLAEHYPVFAAEPWRFVKIMRGLEGGMPHTRGRCIVLSDRVMPLFTAASVRPEATRLLVHEQVHVVQRLHAELFAPLYTEAWGMVRMPSAPTPTAELAEHQLVNPDGIACIWAFPVTVDGTRILVQPQVILGSDAAVPRMPRDFAVVALPVEKRGDTYQYVAGADGAVRSRPLGGVADYVDAFAPSDENFHPNEICAELFSRMVTLDLLGRREDDTPCQKSLRGWAAAYLGKADAGAAALAPLPRMEPPAPPVGPAPPDADEMVYVLGKDETLSAAARKFHVDLGWLIMRNDIQDKATVTDGLRLVVPRPARDRKP